MFPYVLTAAPPWSLATSDSDHIFFFPSQNNEGLVESAR